MKDLAAELNAIQREIAAARRALMKNPSEAVRAELVTKIERLESRYDDLAEKEDKRK